MFYSCMERWMCELMQMLRIKTKVMSLLRRLEMMDKLDKQKSIAAV